MNDFLSEVLPSDTGICENLRKYADENGIHIVRKDCAALLRVVTTLLKPQRILELGTAIGYSSLLMSHCTESAHIDTVEIEDELVIRARHNIEADGRNDRIRVILGDALEVCRALTKPYDMIFMDAAKSQYIALYPEVKRLLNKGGLLVCDNCIFYNKVYTPPEESPHKHRTIVSNLREFIHCVMTDGDFEATLEETGDGVILAVRVGG